MDFQVWKLPGEYLKSEMFQNDVFVGLKDLWTTDPDVRIYEAV